MNNMPYQGVANELAKYGRYGDSMLVHMNPIEVQMLGSLSPTGQLTINPVTGQPEAFLPFLAPLLGSFLGSSLLGGSTLGGLLTTGLSKAAAGAIGSGLATTAATGDLKEGILSGITGFGLGKVFGAMGGADKLAGAAGSTPTPANVEGFFSPTGGGAALNQATTATAPILAGAPTAAPVAGVFSPTGAGAAFNPVNAAQSAAGAGTGGMNFSAGLEELMKPGTFLPIYAGTSVTEGIRQQEELDRIMKEQGLSEEEAKRKYEGDARRAIETVQRLYPQMRPPTGMAAGGQVEGYFDGGMFTDMQYRGPFANMQSSGPDSGFYDTVYGRSSPSDIQGRLRGNISVAAPYASYGALDVGGRGYLPGIAPEFQYFRQPEEIYPQAPSMPGGKGSGGRRGGNYGGYNSMPGGKGGGYGGGYGNQFGGGYDYGNPFGGGYGGGYGSMPGGKGGGYNTGYGGGYGNTFDRYSQPYSNYGGSSFGNFNQIMPF
jgi:hypothetical protein